MKKIETEDEYREALKRFLEICGCIANSKEAEELKKLMVSMEAYEQENCRFDSLN